MPPELRGAIRGEKKFFFDTEFCEHDRMIDLISIGIVSEDGREYRAVNKEFDLEAAKKNPFLVEKVLPKLGDPATWKSRAQIRDEIVAFVGEKTRAKFWSYCAPTDWVALYQLASKEGTLGTLPEKWAKNPGDIKELKDWLGLDMPPHKKLMTHNALDDAKWAKGVYDACISYHKYSKSFDTKGMLSNL